MRQYKSWIAALILGSTLSTNAQQKDPSYFIRLFRSQTNMTPLNYRRNTKP
ncbi:MAG: AraC family transcriptional regulator [Parabacteroides distasonis]